MKYYNYDFKTFELLDNSVNKVIFDNQAASSSTSGFTDKDLYSIKRIRIQKQFTTPSSRETGLWLSGIRTRCIGSGSLKDPNIWMKLEED